MIVIRLSQSTDGSNLPQYMPFRPVFSLLPLSASSVSQVITSSGRRVQRLPNRVLHSRTRFPIGYRFLGRYDQPTATSLYLIYQDNVLKYRTNKNCREMKQKISSWKLGNFFFVIFFGEDWLRLFIESWHKNDSYHLVSMQGVLLKVAKTFSRPEKVGIIDSNSIKQSRHDTNIQRLNASAPHSTDNPQIQQTIQMNKKGYDEYYFCLKTMFWEVRDKIWFHPGNF